ncbi:MAG: ATP-binding protein [Vicingaceae bacterium]
MKKFLQHSFLHLTLGLFCLILLYAKISFFNNSTPNYTAFKNALNNKEVLAEKTLNKLITNGKKIHFSLNKKDNNLFKEKGLSFFIIHNNKIDYWTNKSIAFNTTLNQFKATNGIAQLQNGWYQYLIKKSNRKTYLALILIKTNFPINNKYLKNKFHNSFKLSSNNSIHLRPSKHNIQNKNGDFLFSLQPKESKNTKPSNNWVFLIYLLLGYLFIISYISKQTRKIALFRNLSPVIVIVFIIISRLTLLYYQPFSILQNLELFSPTIFAQSAFLPSLGDLILSSILFSLIIYYFSKAIKKVSTSNKHFVLFMVIISAISPLIFADLIAGLITNSKINFDINYLLDLSTYSFAGIGSITLLFISLILFIKIIINHFINNAFNRNQFTTIFWATQLIAIIVGHFFLDLSAFLTVWILLVVFAFSFKANSKTSIYRSVFLVLVVSATISYGFIHIGKQKEEINKEFIAKKIAKERDPVSEYLFDDIKTKIENDSLIKSSISFYFDEKERIDKYITDHYLKGYFSKYDPNIIGYFNQQDSIYVDDNLVHCYSFFEQKIEQETADPFQTKEAINFLYSDEGLSSYFTVFDIVTQDTLKSNYKLFIELSPKDFSKIEGYPELLLNEKDVTSPINTNTYSFAKYKKGKLVGNSGKFNYSIIIDSTYRFNKDGFCKTTFGAAYHVIYQNDKNSTIILSSPQKTIFNYITTFSYFFIITSLIALIIGLFFKISPFNWKIALTDFSTKIQLFIIASIFLSFILFAWGTSYYIKKQYLDKNKTQLTEKVQSVLIELEHKLGDKKTLNADLYDEMTYYLIKFSNVFYTDIDLYSKDGALLATSRPEIFERGLVSKQMNPEAFYNIHIQKKSNYIHSENIGKLNYISAYVPFRNENQEILAYMNLPYFAKQNELENELSAFYTSLINIYGLLFLVSTIIAVLFANYISEPVRMIKNKISALQLGKSYDLLKWDSNDEIGALVFEYNKKVVELERNASLLVKSERESAWREMAKQVAHEIKNPLTPMKLGIQQLERVAKDKPDDLDERISRTAKTLVEQIDTLTKIADEFSNFAKMPKADEQKINLLPIIETAIDLYQEEEVEIFLKNKTETLNIFADKNQISRVFSNLIKNAIQAIPQKIAGKITISLNQQQDFYTIEINDNGSGIPNDKKDKIFVPNFTTKSTGMGLGLAMVKNIVENANGKIWFETEVGIGTSFFVQFPKA